MSTQAIALMGNSVVLTTNATPGTTNSVPVPLAGVGNLNIPAGCPPNIRMINVGTSMIWISFTSPTAATIAAPTPGTTTLGTPQPVIWLAPNVEIAITLPVAVQLITPNNVVGFWLNTVSAGASQSFQFQLGDGL